MSDTLANFIYERDNFLKILDLGSASVPVFADIDSDGDEDLFVAFRIPNFFRRVLAEGAYSAALIPVFSGLCGSAVCWFRVFVFRGQKCRQRLPSTVWLVHALGP